jgi:PAS domain-containing protein
MDEPLQQYDMGKPAALAFPSAAASAAPRRPRDPLTRQKALVALGRRAIAPPDLSVLMQDAAALLAEMLDAEYCGVAEPSADGQSLGVRLMYMAAETSEPQVLRHRSDLAGDHSLAGYVLQVAHPVIVDDLPREDRFLDRFLLGRQIRSAIAAPLTLQDCSFGALAAFSRQPGYFDQEDLLFLETIAHLLVTSIARKRAEESLAAERRVSEEVLNTVDALVLMLDSHGQIVRMNAASQQTSGFSLAEGRGRPIWNVLAAPEEAESFHATLKRLVNAAASDGIPFASGSAPLASNADRVDHECELLTKHAQRRRIAWSFRTMRSADGKMQSIIATGIDITAQREAEEKARRVEQEAANARRDEVAVSDSPDRGDASEEVAAFGCLPTPINAERRKRARRSYPYRQRVAYVLEGQLPDRDQFMEVSCCDIPAGGFSFLSSVSPPTDSLVVALGVPPKFTYLMAQVAHVKRTEQDGRRFFLVGCNYSGRADYG